MIETAKRSWSDYLKDPHLAAVLILSFASALPLIITNSTIQAWYAATNVNLETIGLLSLVGQPYIYKFLWAPLMDRYVPLNFGRRRSWIFITQLLIAAGLAYMGFLNPKTHPYGLALLAFVVAFFSASQDISIDAYRIDILKEDERGLGATVTAFGGRLGIIFAGALMLLVAAEWSWRAAFLMVAIYFVIQAFITIRLPDPLQKSGRPKDLVEAVFEPWRDMLKRKWIVWILIFIVTYKLCDALALALNTAFLIQSIKFSLVTIGATYKIVSVVATLLGSFLAGVLMTRIGLFRSLLYFGFLQAISNLTFMWLAIVGKVYWVMVLAVFADYFTGGMSTVAFVAFLLGLCVPRYSASQYALLTVFMAMGRVYLGPLAAYMILHMGWAHFYLSTFFIGLPSLALLIWLKNKTPYVTHPPEYSTGHFTS